jgi:hypothetical protein
MYIYMYKHMHIKYAEYELPPEPEPKELRALLELEATDASRSALFALDDP